MNEVRPCPMEIVLKPLADDWVVVAFPERSELLSKADSQTIDHQVPKWLSANEHAALLLTPYRLYAYNLYNIPMARQPSG